jgi:hypothetical protein
MAGELTDLYPAVRAFEADQSTVRRAYDVRWSDVSAAETRRLYQAWQTNLSSTNFAALGQQARIDYILLRNEVDSGLNRIARDRERLDEMNELLPFRQAVHELSKSDGP